MLSNSKGQLVLENKTKKIQTFMCMYVCSKYEMDSIYFHRYIQHVTGWKYIDETYMNSVIFNDFDACVHVSAGRY